MSRARSLWLGGLVAVTLASASCGDPPEKEIQQAQGAIDAARAAGADQYAHDEFAAAQESLQKANDAVAERDYRQALNFALDSRDRARTAAKDASDRKAVARGDAERAIADVVAALNDATVQLRAAQAAHASAKALLEPRQSIAAGGQAVQKARATMADGDYQGVTNALAPVTAALRTAARDLDKLSGLKTPRRRR